MSATTIQDTFAARMEATFDGLDVLVCSGVLDLVTAPQLTAAVALARGDLLLLDLNDVTFMDATGLRAVLACGDHYAGERMSICCPPGAAFRVMELTGVPDRHPVSGTRERAMATLSVDHR